MESLSQVLEASRLSHTLVFSVSCACYEMKEMCETERLLAPSPLFILVIYVSSVALLCCVRKLEPGGKMKHAESLIELTGCIIIRCAKQDTRRKKYQSTHEYECCFVIRWQCQTLLRALIC